MRLVRRIALPTGMEISLGIRPLSRDLPRETIGDTDQTSDCRAGERTVPEEPPAGTD